MSSSGTEIKIGIKKILITIDDLRNASHDDLITI